MGVMRLILLIVLKVLGFLTAREAPSLLDEKIFQLPVTPKLATCYPQISYLLPPTELLIMYYVYIIYFVFCVLNTPFDLYFVRVIACAAHGIGVGGDNNRPFLL